MQEKKITDITPSQIKKLAEEMRKINKKIDLKNPLFAESKKDFVSSVLNENEKKVKDRELNVDEINKKKNVIHVNESEQDKWKRMLKYNTFTDDTKNV